MGSELARSLLHLRNYLEGISHLPQATAFAVQIPPAPASSEPSFIRRKSLGGTLSISQSEELPRLRRSNTVKSTTNIASPSSPSK